MKTLPIQTHTIKEHAKQPNYPVVGTLQIISSILGPRGSSETVLLKKRYKISKATSLKLCIYIYVMYLHICWHIMGMGYTHRRGMHVKHTDEPAVYVDHYDADALNKLLDA